MAKISLSAEQVAAFREDDGVDFDVETISEASGHPANFPLDEHIQGIIAAGLPKDGGEINDFAITVIVQPATADTKVGDVHVHDDGSVSQTIVVVNAKTFFELFFGTDD